MRFIILNLLLLCGVSPYAQRYYTKTGTISFEASTALEDIDPVNKSATSVFDAATGQMEFAVLVKGFEFRKALMQEHFNENYMESSKFPKAVFKGKISNLSAVNFQKPGTYPIVVKGILEIHGVKKEITANGTMKVNGQNISATSKFTVTISDYNISIPGLVKDKIASKANVTVNCNYTPL